MTTTVQALANPSSPHSIVLAPPGGSPFWALSGTPRPGSLLWVMRLARETDFDAAAVPGFMAHFAGEVEGDAFALLDNGGARFVGIPPVEAHEFLGFVAEPTVERLSMTDIARRTGIPYDRLHNWSMRKGFPEPLGGSGAKKWSWTDIADWLWSPAAANFKLVMVWRSENAR